MRSEDVDSRISTSDWEKTPESVKTVVTELAARIKYLDKQFMVLKAQMIPLSEQVQSLENELVKRKPLKGGKPKGFRQNIRSLNQ